jgi:hypothetical protein
MRYAITSGTVSARALGEDDLPADGEVLYAADTAPDPANDVWDEVLGNIRPKNDGERLADLKAHKIAEIQAERDRRISRGFEFNGHRYQSDRESILRISGASQVADLSLRGLAPWNPQFTFIDADNNPVPQTQQSMIALGLTAAQNETLHIYAAKRHKDAVKALIDLNAVNAYDASSGWPP